MPRVLLFYRCVYASLIVLTHSKPEKFTKYQLHIRLSV